MGLSIKREEESNDLSSILAGALWCQRFTDLGLLVAGGASCWIAKADHEPDDEVATKYLSLVLQGTQYGLNKAESVVSNYPLASQRRLFVLLAKLAPNDGWRERYLEDSQEAMSNSE